MSVTKRPTETTLDLVDSHMQHVDSHTVAFQHAGGVLLVRSSIAMLIVTYAHDHPQVVEASRMVTAWTHWALIKTSGMKAPAGWSPPTDDITDVLGAAAFLTGVHVEAPDGMRLISPIPQNSLLIELANTRTTTP